MEKFKGKMKTEMTKFKTLSTDFKGLKVSPASSAHSSPYGSPDRSTDSTPHDRDGEASLGSSMHENDSTIHKEGFRGKLHNIAGSMLSPKSRTKHRKFGKERQPSTDGDPTLASPPRRSPGRMSSPSPNNTGSPASQSMDLDESIPEFSVQEAASAGFSTFQPARFRFRGTPEVTVKEWLTALPAKDTKQRFSANILRALTQKVEATLAERRAHWAKTLTEAQAWALFVYSAELFEDYENPTPRVHCTHQLYSTFNAICRLYGQCLEATEEIRGEWELFRHFAHHFDLAIRALPTVRAVLYRGMGFKGETHDYPLGKRGAWGGCTSASSAPREAARFISRTRGEVAASGSFFMILSDEARCISHLSMYPEEEEHLHPLDLELEVCSVLPSSILQMLSLNISIVTFKRVGASLSLDLCLKALKSLSFVYNDFLEYFIPPTVKRDPYARESFSLETGIQKFLESKRQVLVIASRAGMGKTSCALWLSRSVHWLNHTWLFISLPAVVDPFAPNALIDHMCCSFGFTKEDRAFQELRAEPLVLILDSLDEVKLPFYEIKSSWWELNGFADWNVKLVITCREENVRSYGQCMGHSVLFLHLQPFGDDEVEQYVRKRLEVEAAGYVSPTSLAQTLKTRNPESPMMNRMIRLTLRNIEQSPIRHAYYIPYKLSMGVQLLISDTNQKFAHESDLYEAWLEHWFLKHADDPRGKVDEVWKQAEGLAWALHSQGITHVLVGKRGRHQWFRQCPLRIHNYHPDSLFSFMHKSLQEYLVARFLFHQLVARPMDEELSRANLAPDFPVLRFFRDVYAGFEVTHPQKVEAVRHRLQGYVTASRGQRGDAAAKRRAANSMSLLNAARVSFQGQDLSNVCIPGATLQCADLRHCNLQRADLSGCDLKGAVLDFVNLRGADLTNVDTGQLLRTLDHHTDAVTTVAFAAEMGILVSAAADCTVRVWESATGALLHTMTGHTERVQSVAVAAKGHLAASGGDDKQLRLWYPIAGEAFRTIDGFDAPITSVALSADGMVVFCAFGQRVRCVEVRNAITRYIIEAHKQKVTSIALAVEGEMLASSCLDGNVCLWNSSTGRLRHTLAMHSRAVMSVSLSRDGETLVSGSKDLTVMVWRTATGELLRTLEGHSSGINTVCLAADGLTIVSGSDDKTVRTWRTVSGDLLHTLEGHYYGVNGVALAGDGTLMASGSQDSTIRIWSSTNGELLNDLGGHTDKVVAISFAADGNTIASAADDKAVCVWSSISGQLLHRLQDRDLALINSLAISGDGRFALAGYADNVARLWDCASGQLVRRLTAHQDKVSAVALSMDGALMATGGFDRLLCLWNAKGEMVRQLKGHNHPISCLALSPDGSQMVSGSFDKTARVWDTAAGTVTTVFKGHQGQLRCVVLAQNVGQVVSAAEGCAILLWLAASGQVLQRFETKSPLVTSVAISRDGSKIAAADGQDVVHVWKSKGQVADTLAGHIGIVRGVAMSADGQVAVSGGYDKTVRVWNLQKGTCTVLRHVGEMSLQLFSKNCVFSTDTGLSKTLEEQLVQQGAVKG
eukprot:EG_transcript_249